jgi:phosphohistidine phosphatase
MKTLLLLRHAKSSHEDESLRDFDRPLNERGVGDAKLIGDLIRKKKIKPDLIVGSPAERARQTADLALKSARLKVEMKFDKRIYEASPDVLVKVLSQIKDTSNTVMLVGHNPGFEELLETLTGEAPTLPTASLAWVDLDVDEWNKVRAGSGHLKYRVTPRELKDQ